MSRPNLRFFVFLGGMRQVVRKVKGNGTRMMRILRIYADAGPVQRTFFAGRDLCQEGCLARKVTRVVRKVRRTGWHPFSS
jgi:hypothetical protein